MNEFVYRQAVSALIINQENELLLVNLVSFAEKYYALPGGGIESQESTQEAIYRELNEELGLDKKSLEMIGVCNEPIRYKFEKKRKFDDGVSYDGSLKICFGLRFIGSDKDIQINPDEVRDYKWIPVEKLADYLLFENQLKDTVEKYAEIFQGI